MATPTAGGLPLLSALINEPRVGVWHADIAIDSGEALTGSTTLDIEGVEFVGTVVRSGVEAGRSLARVVGGAAGLGTQLAAKSYRGIGFSSVLADIVSQTGETLDGSSGDSVVNHAVQLWQITQAPAAHAIESIVDEVGASWRVFRSGTLWLGEESFPAVSDPDAVELESMPEHGITIYAPSEGPVIRPGVTFRDRRVSYVSTRLEPNELRQSVTFEDT